MNNKVLVICGPTATGKTSLALKFAKVFSGEIISADSRQVYKEMDIVTGKDIPLDFAKHQSELIWHEKQLSYYDNTFTRIWLTDLVDPNEPFNVAFWKEGADLVIADILSRNKLPIVVGGTGLYIKSLLHPLADIYVPPDPQLRSSLAGLSAPDLFRLLQEINPAKSISLSPSDKSNPRRLIRYLEISRHKINAPPLTLVYTGLQIGLTAPKQHLSQLISNRIDERIKSGAMLEYQRLVSRYDKNLPAFSTPGYIALSSPNPISRWLQLENNYAKRQTTWFLHQPGVSWFDVTRDGWYQSLYQLVAGWYNEEVWDKN